MHKSNAYIRYYKIGVNEESKILISDYDDTLFIDEKGIKENVLKIKEFRKAGNKFIISTARNYESIIEEVEKYDIEVDY